MIYLYAFGAVAFALSALVIGRATHESCKDHDFEACAAGALMTASLAIPAIICGWLFWSSLGG